jgi:hypothetical protein
MSEIRAGSWLSARGNHHRRPGLLLTYYAGMDNIIADSRSFLLCQRDQFRIRRSPEPVPLEAEIFQAETIHRLGHHFRRPEAKVLHPVFSAGSWM